MSVAAVGGAVAGGLIASSGAKSAANAQAQGAALSNKEAKRQFNVTRADQAPFRVAGVAANNQLAYLMGLGTPEYLNAQYGSGAPKSYDYWAKQLQSQFTSNPTYQVDENGNQVGMPGQVDARGLDAAIRERMQQEQARLAELSPNNITDPKFGSLTRKFAQEDLDNDVVYQSGLQFGLDQGTQGINRQAAASGNLLSGATLKALTRYGNDYGSTKANESYNRFNNDNNTLYNRYAGLSGAGQQATNQVQAAGQNMSNIISGNATALGNARGASAIAQSNAWGNALGGAVNAYSQNQLLRNNQSPNSFGWAGMGGFGDSYGTSYGE